MPARRRKLLSSEQFLQMRACASPFLSRRETLPRGARMTCSRTGGVIPQLGDEKAFAASDQLRTMTGGVVMLKSLKLFCFVTAGSAAFLFSAASEARAPNQPPAAKAGPESDAAVLAYWTPERLRNAKPLDMVV